MILTELDDTGYVVDKYFSVLLGRPMMLRIADIVRPIQLLEGIRADIPPERAVPIAYGKRRIHRLELRCKGGTAS